MGWIYIWHPVNTGATKGWLSAMLGATDYFLAEKSTGVLLGAISTSGLFTITKPRKTRNQDRIEFVFIFVKI